MAKIRLGARSRVQQEDHARSILGFGCLQQSNVGFDAIGRDQPVRRLPLYQTT